MIIFHKPTRPSWGVAIMISASLLAHANTGARAVDFQRRYQLVETERQFALKAYAEARESFRKLSESAVEREALLARAAVALGHQEGQFEAAMQEAAALQHEVCRVYAFVSLMSLASDWTGIIEQFGDTPVNTWEVIRVPARPQGAAEELRALVLLKRARAFEQTGTYERAEQDLVQAVDLLVSKGARANPGLLVGLTRLAELRANRLNDHEGAFEANRRIAVEGLGRGRWVFFRAVLQAGEHLRHQGQYDEAIQMIQLMSPDRHPPTSWHGNGMLELARIYRAAGRLAESEKICADILAYPNLDSGFKQQVIELQTAIQGESGNPD